MRTRSVFSARRLLAPAQPAAPDPGDPWAIHHDTQLQALRHLAVCLSRVLVELPQLGSRCRYERAPLVALESALSGLAKLGPGGGSPAVVSPDEAQALWRVHDVARALRGQLFALADARPEERDTWEALIPGSLSEARDALQVLVRHQGGGRG